MLGAIIGDIVGSRFEKNNHLSKDFQFIHQTCHFTDDTVTTLAVGQALVAADGDWERLAEETISSIFSVSRDSSRIIRMQCN